MSVYRNHRLKCAKCLCPPVARLRRAAVHAAIVAATAVLPACRIDILRVRSGEPISDDTVESLDEGRTTLDEALETLGAPDHIEVENEHTLQSQLVYEYADSVEMGWRFRVPTPLFFYQHTFLRFSENADMLNQLRLTFDGDGVLQAKSLRLDQAQRAAAGAAGEAGESGWMYGARLVAGHSFLLAGDGGFRDYDELFAPGPRLGVRFTAQPVPVLTLLADARFARHEGETFGDQGTRVAPDDLEVLHLGVGGRLSFPLHLFDRGADFDYMRRLLFEEDPREAVGWRVYLEGTTGATFNTNVPIKVDGVRTGRLYDNGWVSSSTAAAGLEFLATWGVVSAGVEYYTADEFDEGNTAFDDEGGSFQSFVGMFELGLRF